jgi:hypothetical protein
VSASIDAPAPSHRPGAAALVAGALLGIAVPVLHPAHGAGYYASPMTAGSHLLLFAAVLLVSLGLPALVATGAAHRTAGRAGGALYFVGLWALDGSHGLVDGAVLPTLARRVPAVGHALHAGHASQDLLAGGPMGPIVDAAIPCFALGSLLLAAALWRARVLPRAVAALLAVAWALVPVSFAVPALRAPAVALPYVALLAVGAALLARRPAGGPAGAPAPAADGPLPGRAPGGTPARVTRIAGWAAVAGSVAWLAKLAVIVATDGRVMTTGAAAWLMRAGLLAWLLAAVAGGLRVAYRRGVAARVGAVLVAPVAVAATIAALGTLSAAALGARGPAYLRDEIGIVAIGALGLAAGAATLRRAARVG